MYEHQNFKTNNCRGDPPKARNAATVGPPLKQKIYIFMSMLTHTIAYLQVCPHVLRYTFSIKMSDLT